MPAKAMPSPVQEFRPLTPESWHDFEALLGSNGADDGCWCMWWRLTTAQYLKQKGEQNRLAMRHIVERGEASGILGYHDCQPIAWCAIAPRQRLPKLDRSRKLKRVDAQPVWSIACFFVAPAFRRKGVMAPLVRAAVEFARERGARSVEGYPIDVHGTLSLRLYRYRARVPRSRLRGNGTPPAERCDHATLSLKRLPVALRSALPTIERGRGLAHQFGRIGRHSTDAGRAGLRVGTAPQVARVRRHVGLPG